MGGPTAFVRAKAELSLTAAPLQLGPEQNGRRSGMVTLTLRNDGPEDSLSIDIALTNNHRVSVDAHVGNVIRQQPLKAGESRTITLNVGIEAGSGMTPLSIGAGLHSYAEEANLADNSVQIEVVS